MLPALQTCELQKLDDHQPLISVISVIKHFTSQHSMGSWWAPAGSIRAPITAITVISGNKNILLIGKSQPDGIKSRREEREETSEGREGQDQRRSSRTSGPPAPGRASRGPFPGRRPQRLPEAAMAAARERMSAMGRAPLALFVRPQGVFALFAFVFSC